MRALAEGTLVPWGRRKVRFPCGHTSVEEDVARRVRERTDALWVRCPRCGVIAVVVRPGTR